VTRICEEYRIERLRKAAAEAAEQSMPQRRLA